MSMRTSLLNLNDDQLLNKCRTETFRATGPGGQHRNTTDSAVRLTLKDYPMSAYATSCRSQHQNKSDALKKLRLEIALTMREEGNSPWTDSWSISKKNKQYPFFIAAVLDAFWSAEWKISVAAKSLGISTGKLSKIVSAHIDLLKKINQERSKLNLKPLT